MAGVWTPRAEEEKMGRIEHVNVTVRDAQRTAALMQKLFDWHIRWSGDAQNDGKTVHVGTDQQYLAVYSDPRRTYTPEDFVKGRPLNHVGVEVDDLDTIETRVIEAGLVPFNHGSYEPGRRFYFLDPDGTEYEVVSYR
jgi:catechol 2,3-dioxygenase-like lactoylglutathione lyase family enzyme